MTIYLKSFAYFHKYYYSVFVVVLDTPGHEGFLRYADPSLRTVLLIAEVQVLPLESCHCLSYRDLQVALTPCVCGLTFLAVGHLEDRLHVLVWLPVVCLCHVFACVRVSIRH